MKSIGMNTRGQGNIEFKDGGENQTANHTWYRGEHCNFNPTKSTLQDLNSVSKYILKGWLPEKSYISSNTSVTAFGSCFASNISKWLTERNYNILNKSDGDYADTYIVRFGEGMVNSFVLRQQFEWAFEGKVPDGEYWHGYDAKSFGYDDRIRLKTKAVFDDTDVFVITLGLSEVWCDKRTGDVFWRAIPKDKFDPERHEFRVASFKENYDNINAIYSLIKKNKPHSKVIFTLSPIPLVATFRAQSCITANSVSKALLRGALDEFLREHPDLNEGVFYWPSYEIVTELFSDPWLSDRRHVKEEILDFIMVLFEKYWCSGNEGKMSLEDAWQRAYRAIEI